MKIRSACGWLLVAALLLLAGCSWMPFGRHPAQTLMKSLYGEVDYRLLPPLPSDAYLTVTLSRLGKPDAPARIIASERIAPIGDSPVSFVLTYEPGDVAESTDLVVSASIRAGDRTLASNDTHITVPASGSPDGPVRVTISG